MTDNNTSATGFTLLEVTVALAILATAFVALSALQSKNMTLTEEDLLLTQHTLAAQEILSRLEDGSLPLEEAEGTWDKGKENLKWRIKIEDSPLEGFAKVKVIIHQKEGRPEDGTTFWLLRKRVF
jgi:general secretion pathway protein I